MATVVLTGEQQAALKCLRDGIKNHDHFGAVPDDTTVTLDHQNCLYELNVDNPNGWDVVRLEHLRRIISILDQVEA